MSTSSSVNRTDLPPAQCPTCHIPVLGRDEKFCRKCGYKMLHCVKCNATVREGDSYCTACGARRCCIMERWRQGTLHRSPCFVGMVILVVGASWLTLRYALRKHL
ncbi:unnamed protein product [Anisakis simplex]|uniref:DZANK-type domain-containing protein n=1 Tax=Anisakis simplex TaxID=6269 RepID=A0A158PP33_ANISI|nr:unnamed protein product [Anisakis simplex]